ncbi:glycosyltransferase family 4 protein [Priestia megaterium]|uniref:glycosyltransferase family 4 protein n=1 Tax=Priestia megaterium TaxID=1404 RepID=UPI0023646A2B|nr:glycosyltransferase family 4 protein [Priestia megaterium]MDD1512859.1 glycosyltransferase family 4 protein [Priestia megaterium]
MIKVAHVCTSAVSHKILVDKLDLLMEKGYEIYLISSNEGLNKEYIRHSKIKFRYIDMNRKINPIDDIKSITHLSKLFKKEKFDVVHTHTAKAGILGRVAASIAKIPLIIHTSHGLPFYEGQPRLKYKLYSSYERLGAKFSHALASQNEEDISKIKGYASNKPVFYEGNGIDINKLDTINTDINDSILDEYRKKYNIDIDTKVIFMGARFEPIKDHEMLIKALSFFKKNTKQKFVCLLAGEGPLRRYIEEKINTYNLKDEVKIIGFQKNVYPLIKMSDIICLTSKKEGIPRIIMESMSFRKPVVATNVLGTKELVSHNSSGILVEYGDSKGMAEAIEKVFESSTLAKEFGLQGRNIITNKFTEQIVVNRIDKIYKKMLKEN